MTKHVRLLGRLAREAWSSRSLSVSRLLVAASRVRSCRAAGKARAGSLSPLRREVLRALRNRAFNADDIDALKDAGAVGERTDGLLELLVPPADKAAAARARALVAQENDDRERILRGILRIDPDLGPKDLPLGRGI